eukprot:CAMPEP_0181029632 /NCGR_PEP_ID=MMETSP1070-20121207/5298_1 /TAXON_ID=265543 /ORGANISM="Minutocellus polymorphus, Strain NH13" /LENGTH=31 /DNA_ID= /DNA_START= /DNA_END= /DNA_ORIENTATION=
MAAANAGQEAWKLWMASSRAALGVWAAFAWP